MNWWTEGTMLRLLVCVGLTFMVWTTGAQSLVARQATGPFVSVIRADGRRVGSFVPAGRPLPNLESGGPRVSAFLMRNDIKSAEGLVISAFSATGWMRGELVEVVVASLVPREGMPNVYVEPGPDYREQLRPIEFVRFTLKNGESRVLSEMKRLGMEPMTVRLDATRPQ
jgi:hypothetical protein